MTGRGPTKDMSPRTTLKSCGISSKLHERRNRPIFVMRSSTTSLYRFSLEAFSPAAIRAWTYVLAQSLLTEDGWTPGRESDRQRDDDQQRREHDQCNRGDSDVQEATDDCLALLSGGLWSPGMSGLESDLTSGPRECARLRRR